MHATGQVVHQWWRIHLAEPGGDCTILRNPGQEKKSSVFLQQMQFAKTVACWSTLLIQSCGLQLVYHAQASAMNTVAGLCRFPSIGGATVQKK